MRAHPSCTTTAVAADADRAARISRNATSLGVPGLEVVHGRAPGALAGLRPPDAIFVGGGATRDGVIDACLTALRPAGQLVVHGVTLETEMCTGRRLHRVDPGPYRHAVGTVALTPYLSSCRTLANGERCRQP